MKDKTAAVIPARYGSTRFPGKVLAKLAGKPMIEHVCERVAQAKKIDRIVVATDDERVVKALEATPFECVMTSADHPSGTDRIYEAARDLNCPVIINVQGDEPLIEPRVIDSLAELMTSDESLQMATAAVPASRGELAQNPNKVKVVFDEDFNALYFSRSMIPFLRDGGAEMQCYLHWGIYAYRLELLRKFVSWPESSLEKCEKLEQLRALQNGVRIKVLTADFQSIGVDTPEDLERAEQLLKGLVR